MNQTYLPSFAVSESVGVADEVEIKSTEDARGHPSITLIRLKQFGWKLLFEPRLKPRFGPSEILALGAYTALLAWSVPHHESWFDEAQAWLIARSSTFADLVLHRLHYEGTPALWHILLWCAIRLGLPFAGMHVITASAAVLGTAI